ncbi:hypothetical protein ABZ783_07140 [Micromonospora sp. NPDC047738]|uniref:terminase small subunit n=1 Tax=Micromonospora sp. NPDC047738 TaxID=3155741 RepID=UPI0033F1AB76
MAVGNARLRSADALISPDVAETLANLTDLTDTDAAAVKLARQYAAAIDNAALLAAALDEIPYDEDLVKQVAALAAKVEAQRVLETIGPKLLQALDALGATPKARAARKGGASSAPRQGKLQALRAARRPA